MKCLHGSAEHPLMLDELLADRQDRAAHSTRAIQIAADRVWTHAAASGHRVTCDRGTVWLTLPGMMKDIILHAGQSFTAPGSGKLAVTALSSAAIRIEC